MSTAAEFQKHLNTFIEVYAKLGKRESSINGDNKLLKDH